nr:MAG TPA: hypothetical protein [Caudoviricetes sp.]
MCISLWLQLTYSQILYLFGLCVNEHKLPDAVVLKKLPPVTAGVIYVTVLLLSNYDIIIVFI